MTPGKRARDALRRGAAHPAERRGAGAARRAQRRQADRRRARRGGAGRARSSSITPAPIGKFVGQTIPVAARRVRLHASASRWAWSRRSCRGTSRSRSPAGRSPRRWRRGTRVVLKPAQLSPVPALRLAELAHEAGLPAGVLQVLPGPGGEIGEALVRHPLVRKISFTGSHVRRLAHHAARGRRHQTPLARAGRQVAEHRLRRRRRRPGRRRTRR